MKIGVAISTKDRRETFLEAVDNHLKFDPPNAVFVVVDDGSRESVLLEKRLRGRVGNWHFIRNRESIGSIARVKNQCITALMDAGCTDLFLFDDDAWPIDYQWWVPYVGSREPHLMASYGGLRVDYRDGDVWAFQRAAGYMLYYERGAIERVGGMDERFGVYGGEHGDHSRRIHDAGLTTFRFQDVPDSTTLVHLSGAPSTMTDAERLEHTERGEALYQSLEGQRRGFMPYRGEKDVVLTCLLTSHVDPQRGVFMDNDARLASALLASLSAHGVRGVVLHDNDLENESAFRAPHLPVQVDTAPLNPYVQRWVSYRQYLAAHPEVHDVWCVDATDVELLRDPFTGLERGTLYVGFDWAPVGCEWMIANHAGSRAWMEKHADETMFNAGVVGGERSVMLELCSRIFDLHAEAARRGLTDLGDMGYFNQAVWKMRELGTRVVAGLRVTTPFGANQRGEHSLWKHK